MSSSAASRPDQVDAAHVDDPGQVQDPPQSSSQRRPQVDTDTDGGDADGDNHGRQHNPANTPEHGEPPAGKLFVGGVSWQTSEESLAAYFEEFGALVDVALMKNKFTGKPRGFGFVQFQDPSVAATVVCQNHVIDGRTVDVKPAVPRNHVGAVPAANGSSIRGLQEPLEQDPNPIMQRKIFVGGLAGTVTDALFRTYFAQFGEIADAVVMFDRHTLRSRGFGFVTFCEPGAVSAVMSAAPHALNGKTVEVKQAQPRLPHRSNGSPTSMSGSLYSPALPHRGSMPGMALLPPLGGSPPAALPTAAAPPPGIVPSFAAAPGLMTQPVQYNTGLHGFEAPWAADFIAGPVASAGIRNFVPGSVGPEGAATEHDANAQATPADPVAVHRPDGQPKTTTVRSNSHAIATTTSAMTTAAVTAVTTSSTATTANSDTTTTSIASSGDVDGADPCETVKDALPNNSSFRVTHGTLGAVGHAGYPVGGPYVYPSSPSPTSMFVPSGGVVPGASLLGAVPTVPILPGTVGGTVPVVGLPVPVPVPVPLASYSTAATSSPPDALMGASPGGSGHEAFDVSPVTGPPQPTDPAFDWANNQFVPHGYAVPMVPFASASSPTEAARGFRRPGHGGRLA